MNIQEAIDEFKEKFTYTSPGKWEWLENPKMFQEWFKQKLQETYQQGRKDEEVETKKYILEKLQNHEICTNCLKEIKLEEGEKNISEWCADCWEEN